MNYKINIPFSGTYFISDQRAEENAHCVIDLINMENLAFSRELLSGHITGSAFVLNQTRDKVLLTHHASLNKWLQLGGHCDGIKDPLFTAHKEAYEESGISHIKPLSPDILDIDIQTIPASSKAPEHLHYDIRYLFEATEGEALTVTDESHDLKWVPLDALEDYNQAPALLVMRDKLPNLLG